MDINQPINGHWIVNSGSCLEDRGYWIVAIGSCLLDRVYWVAVLDRGYWIVPIGSCLLEPAASQRLGKRRAAGAGFDLAGMLEAAGRARTDQAKWRARNGCPSPVGFLQWRLLLAPGRRRWNDRFAQRRNGR